MLLNTSIGQKTPDQVIEIIKEAKLPQGQIRGLFSELKRGNANLAQIAAVHILARPQQYPDAKLIRLAQEASTGSPVGPKRITDEQSVRDVLCGVSAGSRIRIVFRRDAGDNMVQLMRIHPRVLKFEERWIMGVIHCVVPSGEWQGIERQQSVLIPVMDEDDIKLCAYSLAKTAESMELLYTQKQFIVANDPTQDMLQKNPDVFYDEGLFVATCVALSIDQAVNWVSDFSTSTQITDVLRRFTNPIQKIDFLERYIIEFKHAFETI